MVCYKVSMWKELTEIDVVLATVISVCVCGWVSMGLAEEDLEKQPDGRPWFRARAVIMEFHIF